MNPEIYRGVWAILILTGIIIIIELIRLHRRRQAYRRRIQARINAYFPPIPPQSNRPHPLQEKPPC